MLTRHIQYNLGISKMKGDFFSWLSHDDLYLPDKITDQIQAYKQFGLKDAIVFSGYQVIDNDGNWLEEVMPHQILEKDGIFDFQNNHLRRMNMTPSYQRTATEQAGEQFRMSQYMYAIFIPAMLAIIIFGDISIAKAPVKLMVASVSIFGSMTIYLIVSSAMRQIEASLKDLTPEEQKLESVQLEMKEPWAIYQIYAAIAIGLPLIAILMAIYA